jgi:hypothetical protein
VGSGQGTQETAREAGVDAPVSEADLDEGVEDVPVAAGRPDPGVDDAG